MEIGNDLYKLIFQNSNGTGVVGLAVTTKFVAVRESFRFLQF